MAVDLHVQRIPTPRIPASVDGVLIGSGLISRLGEEVRRALPGAGNALVVGDAVLANTAVKTVATSLVQSGLRVKRAELPSGEAAKTIENVTRLWDTCRRAGLTRRDVVVAVGGGAITDTAGFTAATYARGIPLVNVPTTLLAMVDAAVGGKVGINSGGIKNAVGSFYPASLIVCDLATLASLPADVARQGLAEVIKVALLEASKMLDILEESQPQAGGLPQPGVLQSLVERSVRVKSAYVAEDPRDGHARHALNLGHTFAHAIETASDYRIPHGDAVAMGLVAAARLGEREGVAAPGTAARVIDVLGRWGLPVAVPVDLDREVMTDAIRHDKKATADGVRFVVPCEGGCALVSGVDPTIAVELLTS